MILVVNHAHSPVCGIHDLGLRIRDSLVREGGLEAVAASCADATQFREAFELTSPDVVVFNWRADLMPWVPGVLGGVYVPTMVVAHNYNPSTLEPVAAGLLGVGFDWVIVLDPGLTSPNWKVRVMGRPIPLAVAHDGTMSSELRIGSFGFAFPHKGFADVAVEINRCLEKATYALHMPEAYFNGVGGAPLYGPPILDEIRSTVRETIRIDYTSDHISGDALVDRLTRNDVNCLFYVPGQPDAGVSSAIDYLIAAQRPIITSRAEMFRVAPARTIWPDVSLSEVLAHYSTHQLAAYQMYEEMVPQLAEDFRVALEVIL